MAHQNNHAASFPSPFMLLDPKAMKKHVANGKTQDFPSDSTFSARHRSEPPKDLASNSAFLSADCLSFPMDDTHIMSQTQGQRAPKPMQAAPTVFDPRKLLDPKGFDKSQRKFEKGDESAVPDAFPKQLATQNGILHATTNASKSKKNEDEGTFGQGGLLEKTFNVSQRDERPVKRQKLEKTEDLEETKKPNFHGGASGGDLSAYVKEKKQEGAKEAGPVPSSIVVDLTGGDDEDVTVVREARKEVCYGRLEAAKVQAHAIPEPNGKSVFTTHNVWPPMKVDLRRHPGRDHIIRVLDPKGNDFGNVDIRTSLGLAQIMDSKNPKFRIQARLNSRRRKPNEYPRAEVSDYYEVNINVYGPKNFAEGVGKLLSKRQIWLRSPFMSDSGIEIYNPQQPSSLAPKSVQRTGTSTTSRSTDTGYVMRTTEEIRNDVVGMFNSLRRADDMPEMDADPRVVTPLLTHQKQALFFLTIKEQSRSFGENEEDNNSLWREHFRPNGMKTYYNVITSKELKNKPPEMLGGLLADMMGLGKTLNILALIVGSLDDARGFGEEECPESDGEKALELNAKTTLIVAPLSTIVNWEQQIAAHLKKKTLNYYIYHGPNRITESEELAKFDVVITTYSTIASEFSRRGAKNRASPLLYTNFFRIVLDEAHAIRDQATQQSQAVCALSAQRRWAVTGTPVQNRLDDLGGLIKFLRLAPFSDKGGFAQYILSPFKAGDPEIVPKLRLLVDSITLRRLKDRIDLPSREDVTETLPWSADERPLYDWFAKDSQNRLQIIVSDQRKGLGGSNYAHILRAIMRLRLLCAHGRELLSEDDLKIAEGFSAETAIDLDADESNLTPSLTAKQAYEMWMLLEETSANQCVVCQNILEERVENEEKDEIIGHMLQCYHTVCPDCIDGIKASAEQASVNGKFKCISCEQLVPQVFFDITKYGVEQAAEARAIARENPKSAKLLGRYGGPHTKVTALLRHLKAAAKESAELPKDSPPIKSVVFSGWTSYLDLIQIALDDNGITSCRLDGRMSRKARNASLEAFRNDPSICVILISIGAGGLGLNLTSASRVFVMEPQFNPAAEQQAIDRVHRLGQTRDVLTYRFIMEDSFEVKMVELQRKKQDLADLSMNRVKLDKTEAAKRRIDELKSLFR